MTQDILKTTLQGLLKVLTETQLRESEKLSDYEETLKVGLRDWVMLKR